MIRALILTAGLALGLCMAAQAAAQPRDLSRLAGACAADTAFGRAYGSPQTGALRIGFSEDWGPRLTMSLRKTQRSEKLMAVEAIASFEDDPGTFETRSASAIDLFKALDAALVADGRYGLREVEDEDNIAYSILDASGEPVVRLEVMRMGVGVWLDCSNVKLQALAMDEALGRTRVERPAQPTLPLPPRPANDICADPARRDPFVASFMDVSMGALEYSQAGSRYSEHLAQWKGQQLVDKGVWSKKRSEDFALSAISDPVIGPEFQAQIGRLMPMLEHLMAFSEAEKTDPKLACTEALKTLDIVLAMAASNERQWKRMHDLYDAEARRLKVTLD